jgi:hypothetical protein
VSLLGSHESHLKTFNSRLLHLTRSDDLRVKLRDRSRQLGEPSRSPET